METGHPPLRCIVSPRSIFGAHVRRPVSCYAFFKGWLLLSQPPGCRSTCTTFSTERYFGTLANGLGSFPHDDGSSLSPSHSRHSKGWYSEFVRIWQVEVTPASKQSLYPQPYMTRLPLKAYRREPAISGFGKLFTPTHRSSQCLAIHYGSDLHPAFAGLHPAHG